MRAPLLRAALAAHVCLFFACSAQLDGPESGGDGAEQDSVTGNTAQALMPEQAALARWTPVINLPLVPVSAANLPDGKVLLWSAEDRFGFGQQIGRTYTTTFDPATGLASERLVSETGHNMFCPGTANLPDGRILVNGGLTSPETSIFDPRTGVWTSAGDMNIPRAYQGTTPLQDGSVLTLGGSWAGGVGNKHGEVWTEGTGWRRLAGVPIDPFLSVDATRDFGMDSHLWLLSTGNGRVFHAGPGINMNFIDTEGSGRVLPIGRRADDEFSINGNAVMYDVGRILKVGGAPGYDGIVANSNAYVIELGTEVTVRKVQSMAYRRAFHNSVVLPNGQVLVLGGATVAVGFTDNNAVLAPEIFDPATETFTALPPMQVARNYHGVALLLPDGRVISAGGGLCGTNCAANHPNLQLLSPPYLFNDDGSLATRPVITSAPAQVSHGTVMNVQTDGPVSGFALLRASSTTHALNNDQRRIPLSFAASGTNTYAVEVPQNPGWALPGLYMLFALDAHGVPSIARSIRVGASAPLKVKAIDPQASAAFADTSLAVQATSPSNAALTFGARGLPPGLSIDVTSGLISGAPSSAGRYLVEVSASDGTQTVSTEFPWIVSEPGTTRFVMLETLSEVNGNPWASAAELDLIDDNGQVLSRGAWTVSADSAEPDSMPENAIDGNPQTIWHSQWRAQNPVHPHWLRIDLGGSFRVAGFRYLPRQDGSPNGSVAQYRVYTSTDGLGWGLPVSSGNLAELGAAGVEKTVFFENLARGKLTSTSSVYPNAPSALAVDGNRDGVFADGSVSHTQADANAFWEVDLGASYQLFGVRLFNRADCCAERLSNFYVLASEAPMAGRSLAELLADPAVQGVQVGGTAPATTLLTLSARARYVRVQLGGTNYLQLAEVEVYGRLGRNRAPTLTQPVAPDLAVGSAAALDLSARDPDGDTLTFSATNLPPGLSLDASTGAIRGTVTTAGSYAVDASVSDGQGGSDTRHFNWFVGLRPPTVEPVAAPMVPGGSTVSYTAQASGNSALQYQWNFGDGSGDGEFSDSASASHTFASPGVYVVTVTVRTSEGGATTRQFLQAVKGPTVSGTPLASSQLALSRDGARLWAVNPDNDSVSVFDTASLTRLAEVPVGLAPRSLSLAPDGRIWVANKGSSSLSIVSPSSLAVERTIVLPRASQPYGVLVAEDGSAYVALGALGRVLKLAASGATLASLDVGPNPRHLALTAQGDRLLVSRFITRPQPGESTAVVQSETGGQKTGGELLVVDTRNLTVARTIVLEHSDKVDSTVSGRGVPNYLGAAAISPDGVSAWVPSKQDNIKRGSLREQRNLDFQNTVRAISSRIDLASESEDYAARVDHDNSGVASAAAFHPSGVYLFVALETSRHVAVLDAHGKRELFRVSTGLAPEGLTLSPDGRRLYVHNFMDRTVSVYDLASLLDHGETDLPVLATLASVSSDKLSPQVLRGKQLFYDARDTRLARDGYMSCASCHNDGGHDGRVWDITGMGEGLRNTIALRGRAGSQGRLHWSANFDEVQDFEGQIRALAQGTGLMSDADFGTGSRSQPLGDEKAGSSADLDALATYVSSLASFEPSPYRSADGALTPDAVAGRSVFASQCASCHGGSNFTDSPSLAMHDVGTLKPASGQRLGGPLKALDTPTLRDAWATAPYLHDGSAATLEAAISAHTNLSLSSTDLTKVAAFVRQLGSEEPLVTPPSPTGLTGQYFANRTLTAPFVVTRPEAINFDWGSGAPAAGVPADNFSVRWTGQLIATSAGSYKLQTQSDDGVRVRVNGALVINNWTDHGPTTDTSAAITLAAGQRVDISVEYYERGGGALMRLFWQPPGQSAFSAIPAAQLCPAGVGLTGHYFANNALTGAPALKRVEAVNFAWADAAPGAGVPADNFSVRWSGQLNAPITGNYRLQTVSDDGIRVWLNGSKVIDNWTPHGPTADTSPTLFLLANQRYDLMVEYNDTGGGATMQLSWLLPGATAYAAIPTVQLYPGGVGLRGSYYPNNALTGTPVLTRTEPVNFAWGAGAPAATLPTDNFSVRWQGKLDAPVPGSYRLQTLTDDGIRVYLNGALVINNWTPHSPTLDTSAAVTLAAGQRVDIVVEYQELGGDSTMRLFWQVPGAPGFVTIPGSALHGL